MIREEVINEVKDRLVEKFKPQRIIFFGCQARETADEKSDVDILVVCPIQGSRRALKGLHACPSLPDFLGRSKKGGECSP